jgi:hypothetical protein
MSLSPSFPLRGKVGMGALPMRNQAYSTADSGPVCEWSSSE